MRLAECGGTRCGFLGGNFSRLFHKKSIFQGKFAYDAADTLTVGPSFPARYCKKSRSLLGALIK